MADTPDLKVDNQRNLIVTVGQVDGLGKGKVPFTAERWAVLARTQVAHEANLFNSGLAFDLDGDGKTSGVFRITCQEGSATVELPSGNVELKPFRIGENLGYEDRVRRLGAKGGFIVLYGPCQPESYFLGLDTPRSPIVVEQVDGPAVQIVVMEPLSSPTAKTELGLDNLMVNGQRHSAPVRRGLAFEPLLGPEPTWMAVHWVMVPVKSGSVVTASITGPRKAASVLARMNSSPEPMKRRVGKPAFQPVASQPKRSFFVDLAKRGLEAYRSKDIDAMVALVPSKSAAEAKLKISKGGVSHERLFGEQSWRWQGIKRWTGSIGQARFMRGEARLALDTGQAEGVLLVSIVEQDGGWFFKDLQRQTKAEFDSWGIPLE